MVEVIGWLGAFLLGICGAPQAYKCHTDGNAIGISHLFIWFWFFGEVLMIIYVPLSVGWNLPIMSQLLVNLLFGSVIIKYRYWPTSK